MSSMRTSFILLCAFLLLNNQTFRRLPSAPIVCFSPKKENKTHCKCKALLKGSATTPFVKPDLHLNSKFKSKVTALSVCVASLYPLPSMFVFLIN